MRVWAQGPGCVGGSGRREGAQVPGISPVRSLPWKLRRAEGAPGDPGSARSLRGDEARSAQGSGNGGESPVEQVHLGFIPERFSDPIGAVPAQNRGRSPQCC